MAEPAQMEIEEVAPVQKPKGRKAELVKVEKPATPAKPSHGSDTAAILGMIERLSCQPDVQVERVDQLFALYQRMQADAARKAFDAAFAEMQPELPVIEKRGAIEHDEKKGNEKTGKKVVQSRYAKWEDIVEGVSPVLANHGFALSFKIDQPTPDRVLITGTLSHRDGHRESTSFSLPIDGSGSKNNVQGWASSVSYGKRYTGCALLNIVSREGEDDDGNAAAGDPLSTIDENQQAVIRALLDETKSNVGAFLEVAKAESVSDILAKDFDNLVKLLNKKKLMAKGSAA